MAEKGLTYAEAGVDIDAGNRMVELIKPLVRATARPGADAEIGGFGGRSSPSTETTSILHSTAIVPPATVGSNSKLVPTN